MRMRWRPTLCLWGLILFGLLTYGSLRANRTLQKDHHGRYFWWGSVRLDSDPLNKRPSIKPCVPETGEECIGEPLYIWVDPGLIERALVFSAFPAFLLVIAVGRGLSHLGVSELLSFRLQCRSRFSRGSTRSDGFWIAGNTGDLCIERIHRFIIDAYRSDHPRLVNYYLSNSERIVVRRVISA